MRINRKLLTFFGAICFPVAVSAQETVLAWVDDSQGVDAVPGALTKLAAMRPGLTFFIAPDQATFNTLLSSGSWSLAIFGEQNFSVYGGSEAELEAYKAGGGLVLGATWLDGSGFSAFMDASSRTSINGEVVTAGPPMSNNGVGTTVQLYNPGWGVFSSGWAGAGECFATLDSGGCAALVGNLEHTLLLGPLFDTYFDQNQGEQFVANGACWLLGGDDCLETGVVPEPASMTLLATGLVVLYGAARRRRGYKQI